MRCNNMRKRNIFIFGLLLFPLLGALGCQNNSSPGAAEGSMPPVRYRGGADTRSRGWQECQLPHEPVRK